jgi:5-methylcytosine-specific restriction protein A
VPVKAKTFSQRQGRPSEPRPTARARGYDRAWERLRNAFLAQHPMCFAPGCNRAADVVDHIIPIVVNPALRLAWSNCRPACTHHHNALTARFKREGINELPPAATKDVRGIDMNRLGGTNRHHPR